MRKITVLLMLSLMGTGLLFAGGYQVNLHGQRNMGMGLIGTSLSLDGSSAFYNPGGLSFLKSDFSFSGGLSFMMGRVTYQPVDMEYQAHIKHKLNTPLYFYGAMKATKNLGVGIAVNTPFGNGLAWEDDWNGRFLIQDIKFKAITIQPTVSYKIKDLVSIGVGLIYAFGNIEMNKALPIEGLDEEGKLNIKGSTNNWGFNAGVMVHPYKSLSLGISYRSLIRMKVKSGDVTMTVPESVSANYPETNKVSTALPLPANLDFGASYEFGEKWLVGFNLCYVFWGVHDSITFDFENNTDKLKDVTNPTLYKDRMVIRVGAQYKALDWLTVRAGGYYDPSPVPDDYFHPQTPNSDQIGLTCGLSVYPFKNLSIDAAFLYLMGMERESYYSPDNFGGKYKSAFYIPGIGLTYTF